MVQFVNRVTRRKKWQLQAQIRYISLVRHRIRSRFGLLEAEFQYTTRSNHHFGIDSGCQLSLSLNLVSQTQSTRVLGFWRSSSQRR
jgi:hypothetical protein